jgi:chromate transporter
MREVLDVFVAFLRLGSTSFGGPIAHLGYFRREFVERRRWLDDSTFGECIALSQLLPGPASSQTGMLIGWLHAGPLGAFAAWIAFTLPAASLMTLAALGLPRLGAGIGWLHGLFLVAIAIVASALVAMRTALAPDTPRIAIALGVFALVLAVPLPATTPLTLALAAIAGLIAPRTMHAAPPRLDLRLRPQTGLIALALFIAAFIALGVWAEGGSQDAILANTLFRVGSLVFGGGHVVLPLLQTQVVATGIAPAHAVVAGYALAQAMPGPLFTIASYVGASAFGGSLGVAGAFVATVAIFAPSFFLIAASVPFYTQLASNANVRAALCGVNAGVVGLLAAAFVSPLWLESIRTPRDGVVALVAFAGIQYAKVPAGVMVVLGLIYGLLMER